MKMRFLLLMILPACLLAGCSKDGMETDNGPDTPAAQQGDIVFDIGITLQSDGEPTPQTRVMTDSQFKSSWEVGDEIGIFATIEGEPFSTDNYIQNAKLTFNGASWEAETPLYWPVGDKKLVFVAYYPYLEGTDATDLRMAVKTDQNGQTDGKSNLSLSHAMWSRYRATHGKGEAVRLKLEPCVGMIQLTLDDAVMAIDRNEEVVVKLRGVKTQFRFYYFDENSTEGVWVYELVGDPADITMYRVEQPGDADYHTSYTFRALLAGYQNLAGSTSIFRIYNGGTVLDGSPLTANVYIEGCRAERFTQKIPYQALPLIKAGMFLMGSSDGSNYPDFTGGDPDLNTTPAEPDRYDKETQHKVTLTKDFYMGKYQVTNARYAAFLNANSISEDGMGAVSGVTGDKTLIGDCMTKNKGRWGVTWNGSKWVPVAGYQDHPVIWVTWYGAKAYADWVGGALPTEAQWEYACRAGTTTAYSFGDTADGDYMWYDGNNDNYGTKAVGGKIGNPWSLYDMHGNLLEWCADLYQENLGSSAVTDPTGPTTTTNSYRMLRGGSWRNNARFCRSAYRYSYSPGLVDYDCGFRVVFIQE